MKIRSITILSIVLLFSTSDSLSAQLFKKTKAAVKKGAEMENARLAINASFYELLQNKQYPVPTSLSDCLLYTSDAADE